MTTGNLTMTTIEADILQALPDPEAIHRRLGDVLREERLLRRLLRLSVEASRERERRKYRGDASEE